MAYDGMNSRTRHESELLMVEGQGEEARISMPVESKSKSATSGYTQLEAILRITANIKLAG